MPFSASTDDLWTPPYICLAESPRVGYALSVDTARGKQVKYWDLWEVWTHDSSSMEELYFDGGRIKELRVYETILKQNVWLCGVGQS